MDVKCKQCGESDIDMDFVLDGIYVKLSIGCNFCHFVERVKVIRPENFIVYQDFIIDRVRWEDC